MDIRKLERFRAAEGLLACPVCGAPLALEGRALRCAAGHSFDVARQGYVNLLRGGVRLEGYDRASFMDRRRVFAAGLYEPIAAALAEAVSVHAPSGQRVSPSAVESGPGSAPHAPGSCPTPRVLDAGCGEGYFARELRRRVGARVAAFDISKDSVQLAAAADAGDGIVWFVADLASIPVRPASADCVLNVFSPANYAEFRRALAPGGVVVKAVPTPRHLQELRAAAAGQLAHAAYENDRVLGHFAESCALIERRTAGGAFAVDAETVRALAAMTPLFFHVDAARVDLRAVRKVTVEAEILVGRMA